MGLSTQLYKGSRDFYSEDMCIRNYIFEVWRKVCISYGYEEYDVLILELVELFSAKSGDELVNQQSYIFTDRAVIVSESKKYIIFMCFCLVYTSDGFFSCNI